MHFDYVYSIKDLMLMQGGNYVQKRNQIRQFEKNGYSSIQEFIKETLREKLFDETSISKKELALVTQV